MYTSGDSPQFEQSSYRFAENWKLDISLLPLMTKVGYLEQVEIGFSDLTLEKKELAPHSSNSEPQDIGEAPLV